MCRKGGSAVSRNCYLGGNPYSGFARGLLPVKGTREACGGTNCGGLPVACSCRTWHRRVVGLQNPLMQSACTLHALPEAQAVGHTLPQSTSVSPPFLRESLHEGACSSRQSFGCSAWHAEGGNEV